MATASGGYDLHDRQLVLPVYLLVEVSRAVTADVGGLDLAVRELVRSLAADPVVDDIVMLSVITFGSRAATVVPLAVPSAISVPRLVADGGTHYGAAFREYHRVFEQDRAAWRAQGARLYRPRVILLAYRPPHDPDYLDTFRALCAWDPETKSGNRAFPVVLPVAFNPETEPFVARLAYPDFGTSRGRWFRVESSGRLLGEAFRLVGAQIARIVYEG